MSIDPVPASSREAADLNLPSKVRAEYPNKALGQAAEPLGTRHPSTAIPAERGEARPPEKRLQVLIGRIDDWECIEDDCTSHTELLLDIKQCLESVVEALAAPAAQPETHVGIRQLQRINAARAKRWHKSDSGVNEWTPLEWAGAMCGEAGEAANAAKKLKRVRDNIQNLDGRGLRSQVTEEQAADYAKAIAKEVADTVIYGVLLCEAVGADLQDAIVDVFNTKSEEYNFPERLAAPAAGEAPPGQSNCTGEK